MIITKDITLRRALVFHVYIMLLVVLSNTVPMESSSSYIYNIMSL